MKDAYMGLLGVLGIWITAGLALPMVNILKPFKPTQLMVARGTVTALLAAAFTHGNVADISRYTLLSALAFALACLGLFQGIRLWGVNPTIIVVTATPLVNFSLTWYRGHDISSSACLSLGFMICGVTLALKPWKGKRVFYKAGMAWAVFGTVMNGLFYDFLGRAKTDSSFKRCFWQAVAVCVVGLAMNGRNNWPKAFKQHRFLWLLPTWAVTHGFLYFYANILAFDNIPTDAASVLAQGETPAVILMSGLLLGEKLNKFQWLGVLIALSGAWYLSHSII